MKNFVLGIVTALLMIATVCNEELHVAVAVRSCVELSEYVPVALNCWLEPFAIVGFGGVTLIELRVGGVGGFCDDRDEGLEQLPCSKVTDTRITSKAPAFTQRE